MALGERLFHDPRLSQDNRTACASCHPLNDGGTDRKTHLVSINNAAVSLNTPTVYNAALSFRHGWLGDTATLGEFLDGKIGDRNAMNTDWSTVAERLRQDGTYVVSFREIYDEAPQASTVRDAVAAFLESLVTPDSRFDLFLRGDSQALTAEEQTGYLEFKAHGCIACHQGINVGGNVFQRFGVFGDYFADRGGDQSGDGGRLLITGRARDLHVFRVPSLRNVALTPPYFHDGSAATLEDAVRVMAHYQLGQIPHEADVQLIVKFLRTLTGRFRGRDL
jgi:cytochrome c peroxidase